MTQASLLLPPVIAGHVIHTTAEVEDDLSRAKIPGLWEKTLCDTELCEWSGREGAEFYGLYFGYDKQKPGAFSFLAGVGALTLTEVPPWWTGMRVTREDRVTYTAPGVAPKCAIDAWKHIWADTKHGALTRSFTSDVEIYFPNDTASVLVGRRRTFVTL